MLALVEVAFPTQGLYCPASAGMFPFTGMEGEREEDKEMLAENGVTGRGWKESAKGRGRKRRMEAGGRVRIGNREQGSAKKMQVFILS